MKSFLDLAGNINCDPDGIKSKKNKNYRDKVNSKKGTSDKKDKKNNGNNNRDRNNRGKTGNKDYRNKKDDNRNKNNNKSDEDDKCKCVNNKFNKNNNGKQKTNKYKNNSNKDGNLHKQDKIPRSLPDPTVESVIVIFRSTLAGSPHEACASFKTAQDIQPDFIYHSSVKGFSSRLKSNQLSYLAAQEHVLRIERDHILHAFMIGDFNDYYNWFCSKYTSRDKKKCGNDDHWDGNKCGSDTLGGKFKLYGKGSRKHKKSKIKYHSNKDNKFNIDEDNSEDNSDVKYNRDIMDTKNKNIKDTNNTRNKNGRNKDSKNKDEHKSIDLWNIHDVRKPFKTDISSFKIPIHLFILDTGITNSHPDLPPLPPQVRRNFVQTELHRDDDLQGHSSHIAGIAGAINGTKKGLIGIAPGVQMHSIKVLDKEGNGNMSWVIAGIDFITQTKLLNPSAPMVANLSLGFDSKTQSYNALDEAIDRAIQVGIIFVVAAGNDGQNAQTYSPAHVERTITVGAYNKHNEFASFSNWGDCIDILAPGVDIYSTWINKGYKLMSGTSMASPHVSACACLYLYLKPYANPDDVKFFLLGSGKRGKIKNVPPTTPNICLSIDDELVLQCETLATQPCVMV